MGPKVIKQVRRNSKYTMILIIKDNEWARYTTVKSKIIKTEDCPYLRKLYGLDRQERVASSH